MSSPLMAVAVPLGPDDHSLIRQLTEAFPDHLRRGREANALSWMERRLRHTNPLPSGFQQLRQIMRQRIRPHMVHVTGMELPIGLPPTPTVNALPVDAVVGPCDIGHLAIACTIGVVYGSDQLRGGRLIHDIFPAPHADGTNTAHDARYGFSFHIDGGSDPDNAPTDFTLQCMRNDEGTPTFASTIAPNQLPTAIWQALTSRVFEILHEGGTRSRQGARNVAVVETDANGHPQRLNYYDDPSRLVISDSITDPEARGHYQDALAELRRVLEANTIEVVLAPGDLLIVDNHRTVHGRRPSGAMTTSPETARWLRRCWISTDPTQVRRTREAPHRVLASIHGPGNVSD